MNKVKVMICGGEYTLCTDEAPEYVRELSGRVERAMKELLETPRVSLSQAAVLVALEQADSAEKALRASDNLRAQMKEYLDDNARARMEADRLRQENSILRQKLALFGQE